MMSASLVWQKDVTSVGVIGVQEGYQVGFQTLVDVGTCCDSHTSSIRLFALSRQNRA